LLTYDNLLLNEFEEEQDLCAALQELIVEDAQNQNIENKEEIINKYYPDLRKAFEKRPINCPNTGNTI